MTDLVRHFIAELQKQGFCVQQIDGEDLLYPESKIMLRMGKTFGDRRYYSVCLVDRDIFDSRRRRIKPLNSDTELTLQTALDTETCQKLIRMQSEINARYISDLTKSIRQLQTEHFYITEMDKLVRAVIGKEEI